MTGSRTANTTRAGGASGGKSTATVAALNSIQDFWVRTAKSVGIRTYERVAADRLHPAGRARFLCDGEPIDPADVEDNAYAVRCDEGQTIVWDPRLLADLTKRHGATAPSVILAHEWGHLIADQAGVDLEGVLAEQYADCMAGAFVADAVKHKVKPFDAEGALDATVATVAEFRDDPGGDANDANAHGSAFDRLRAFQEGFEKSATFCGSYQVTPPTLTEMPFSSGSDSTTMGNLKFTEILSLAKVVLKQFAAKYPKLMTPITAPMDAEERALLVDLHARVGDSAPLVVLALDGSADAQRKARVDPEDDDALLEQACVVGGFYNWLAGKGSPDVSISAGDLDEAVGTFIDLTDPASSGLLFDQITKLRIGFTRGAAACRIPKR